MQRILKPEVKIAASAALLQRGCVNVIGLEEIKSKAGNRWDKSFQSIYARLEILLRQKLGAADFFVQLDETSFLVSMPSTTEEEAQIFCIRVAHELHTSLLGRCEIEQLKIARAMRLEGDTLELEELAGPGLIRLVASAGLQISSNGNASNRRAPSGQKPGHVVQSVKHSHQFLPMWNVQKEAITTYRCVTIEDQAAPDYKIPSEKFRAAVGAMLSRVRHATNVLAKRLDAGQRFLISIPIPYDLLSTPVARMEITAICRELSSELRPYLTFEISELPNGVPQSRLSELVGSLKPFCRGVAVHLSARIQNYDNYQGTGLYAVGMSPSANSASATEAGGVSFERCVDELCVAARKLHIMSFALEVPDLEALRCARDLGVNFISGRLIGPALAEPAPIRLLSFQEIIAGSSNADCASGNAVPRTGTEG